MSKDLKFSPEQASQVASSIKKKADNADALIEQLSREIAAVSGWWSGESQTAFVDQFNTLKPSFKKMIECVGTISTNLTEIARIKGEAETQIASKLRSK
ncbi:WXG100 family type VII secretion target [Paenibacillus sp. GSMTC-2017]|uniref:WXG100 family type VII secretion target n=1 Tax=Paenibacillus sp. GSMTC-2017 TaxID=2794350 RepID=UPI0018D82D04|nr:WXG100 family type VII secretion target [Paenibacillus sp. GSMTC-2017]MBH5320062.1 WXG100 family type VII secretion target [Paenibacillus sp. GSMTC-2017]